MENLRNINPVTVQKSKIIELERGKVPPCAIDLEEAILGAILIDKKGAEDGLLILKSSDVFYQDAHKYIFEAIQDLYKKSEPIDMLTVSSRLKALGTLELAGGYYYLTTLTQKVSSSAHIEFHSRIIMQKYIQRAMIRDCSELIAKAYDDDADVFDLLDDANLKLTNLQEQTNIGVQDMTITEALDVIEKKVELLSTKQEGEISGVFTGFRKIDLITSGFQPTDLIVIAARPGMGKTSFVMKTVLANALKGIPGGFVSLEMSTVQLVTRMIACNSHFHLNQLFRTGFEHSKYFEQFASKKYEMQKFGIHFDDRSRELFDIVAKVRLWKRKYDIKYVIIDYLQIMSFKSLGKNAIREQEISMATRTLKALAKELEIPVILLSQLSRDVESRGDKKPQLKDLRESGAIEQDADLVGFIYRSDYYGVEPDDTLLSIGANCEFIIAKHRNGSLDVKGLYFDQNKTKFMDPEELEFSNQYDNEMNNQVSNDLPKPTANEAFGPGPNGEAF